MFANIVAKYSSFVVDVDKEVFLSMIPSATFIIWQTQLHESGSNNFLQKEELIQCKIK